MSTCGYICPSCNGTKITEDGLDCDWCVVTPVEKEATTDEELAISPNSVSK